jgi:AraC-like DNA-binding protein/DNA-binding CsgD family transcriptional regulator
MTVERPSGSQRVAADIAAIAEAPLSIPERAQALLDPLGRLVPFQGAWISLLDPERRTQPPVVAHGFGADHIAYMSGPAGVEEIEQLGLFRLRGATRISDLSVPLQEVYSWTEFLAPTGFCGGLVVGLFAPDGRHLGGLGLNTDTDAHPTEAARGMITTLAPAIAHAVDPLRSITAAARVVTDARAGVVLAQSGAVLPLPGVGGDPLLVAGSPVLAAAAQHMADGSTYASFLCPYRQQQSLERHARVTVLACASQSATHLAAAVLLSAPGDMRALTDRELEILGKLVEGSSYRHIAATLGLSECAMAGHIEDIRVKLEASTRTLAMLRAARRGLYVPSALAAPRSADRRATAHRTSAPRPAERPFAMSLPASLRRAVEAIEEHPEHRFTTRDIAEIAHVSPRTLQQGFRQHMGISPMRFLREVRLARVHDDLRRAGPGDTTVARIAHRWGFTSLSRFAAAYRASFGIHPAGTLRDRERR